MCCGALAIAVRQWSELLTDAIPIVNLKESLQRRSPLLNEILSEQIQPVTAPKQLSAVSERGRTKDTQPFGLCLCSREVMLRADLQILMPITNR